MNDCCTTETGETARADLAANKWAYVLLWRLPWVAILASMPLKDQSLKAGIWTTAFTQMGVACLVNASACGRLRCYFSAPWYVLAAVASFLNGAGRLSIPWPVVGGLGFVGTHLLTRLPERLWSGYAGRRVRTPAP